MCTPQTNTKPKWASASYAIQDAYTDFILSRQAMLCSLRTIEWYQWTLGRILGWLEINDVDSTEKITARHIRAYLAEHAGRTLSSSYTHNHARVIWTFVKFVNAEVYITEPIVFRMSTH